MIREVQGDLLEADAEALVNTVNCVGVMGRGIALRFRKKWPGNYKAYVKACEQEEIQPGRMFIQDVGGLINPRYIVNFPTKQHWKGKSRMEFIENGLSSLRNEIVELGIRSIAVPALGCGLGGLAWGEVRQRIVEALGDLPDLDVLLYPPSNGSDVLYAESDDSVPPH